MGDRESADRCSANISCKALTTDLPVQGRLQCEEHGSVVK